MNVSLSNSKGEATFQFSNIPSTSLNSFATSKHLSISKKKKKHKIKSNKKNSQSLIYFFLQDIIVNKSQWHFSHQYKPLDTKIDLIYDWKVANRSLFLFSPYFITTFFSFLKTQGLKIKTNSINPRIKTLYWNWNS
jgi:hypothetical protein